VNYKIADTSDDLLTSETVRKPQVITRGPDTMEVNNRDKSKYTR